MFTTKIVKLYCHNRLKFDVKLKWNCKRRVIRKASKLGKILFKIKSWHLKLFDKQIISLNIPQKFWTIFKKFLRYVCQIILYIISSESIFVNIMSLKKKFQKVESIAKNKKKILYKHRCSEMICIWAMGR